MRLLFNKFQEVLLVQLSNNHVSIKTASDITQICQPLFKNTEVTYFSYVRIYKNYKILSLTSNPEFQKYYYSQEYYKKPSAITTCINPGQHLLSSQLCLSDMVADAKSIFNIDNFLEVVSKHNEYFEIVRFGGASNNNKVLEMYLNQSHSLTMFKFYFLEKAQGLIEQAQQPNKLIDLSKYLSNSNDNKILNTTTDIAKFKSLQNNINRYYFGQYKDEYFTRREVECLLHFLNGKNSVEISTILNISEKTIRGYLSNMISKMGVSCKSELIKKSIKLGFLILTT